MTDEEINNIKTARIDQYSDDDIDYINIINNWTNKIKIIYLKFIHFFI